MSKNILWVDDDARAFLSPLLKTIERSGLRTDVATTFDEAEKMLKTKSYSAVLLDIILPHAQGTVLDHNLGMTLARRLRSGYYLNSETSGGTSTNIPIIALSIVRRDEIAEELTTLEMEYFDKTMLLESNVVTRLISALAAES